MKAAVVTKLGEPPVYGDFETPSPNEGQSVVRVTASALSHLTRNRASGAHYSTDAKPPFVPGVDGAGVDENGRRVYFLLPQAPYGAMAERCLVDARHQIALPEGLPDESAAAMAIPGMSSWAALVERARLRKGETVLVNGATGTSGRLAVQIAKHLGAAKVVATGRNERTLDDLRRLGADVVLPLIEDGDALEESFKKEFRRGVDVVLDYLWGRSAERLIVAAAKAGPEGVPVRFVQIGSIAGANVELPAAALRSSGLELMGSGLGSVPLPKLLEAIQGVLEAAPAASFEVSVEPVPLAQVTQAWKDEGADSRIVFRP